MKRCLQFPCEAIFNNHADVYRSALIGIGARGSQLPVLIAEPLPGKFPQSPESHRTFVDELYKIGQSNKLTRQIRREQHSLTQFTSG